jgi:hypothetical protein
MKVMKTDQWDERLTCHIQHPLYRQVIEEIMAVSKNLETFVTVKGSIQGVCHDLPPAGEARLTARALARRRLHERKGSSEDDEPTSNATNDLYLSRDSSSPSEARYARVM